MRVPVQIGALGLLGLLGLLGGRAPAQAANENTVFAAGLSEIRRNPEFLRVQVEVLATGKDLKEALTKLKARKDKVQGQLATWKAVDKSIQFSEAGLTSLKTPMQQQYEGMLLMRLKQKPLKGPAFVVGTNLKVDLPLLAVTPEEVLVAIENLQAKVRAADLSGIKEIEKEKDFPRNPGLAEELEAYPYEGPRRGDPSFLFVAKITEAERDRALAQAFDKARIEAARYAKAAEAQLGSLHQLSAEYSEPDDGSQQDAARARDRAAGVPVEWTGEAVGAQPGPVSVRFMIKVQFNLKTK